MAIHCHPGFHVVTQTRGGLPSFCKSFLGIGGHGCPTGYLHVDTCQLFGAVIKRLV